MQFSGASSRSLVNFYIESSNFVVQFQWPLIVYETANLTRKLSVVEKFAFSHLKCSGPQFVFGERTRSVRFNCCAGISIFGCAVLYFQYFPGVVPLAFW